MSCYLVTGASGFIGRCLCKYLQSQEHEVRALLRRFESGPWDTALCCDLEDQVLPDDLMRGVDGVFHLANVAHSYLMGKEADRYWKVNVDGTAALLQAAADAGVQRFVYFSSTKAMGDPGEACVDETWECMPEDAYSISKLEAERKVLTAGKKAGIHVCNLRPALVYGPCSKGNLYQMLHAIQRRRFPPLPEFGNRRSMVSQDDLVAAAWLAMEDQRANGKTYIVSDGVEYSTRMIYEAMCAELGVSLPGWYLPEQVLRLGASLGDFMGRLLGRRMMLNSAIVLRLTGSACYRAQLIRNELGWQPKQHFIELLPAMVKFLQQ